MINHIKNFLKEHKIDFLILPNSDAFFSEYLPESEKRLQYLTGFTGSNAIAVIGQEQSYFFTDGRYILQAGNEIDLAEFRIINMMEKSLLSWIEEELGDRKIAIDPQLSSVAFVQACQKIIADEKQLVFLKENPVDHIWQDRPVAPSSAAFFCDEKLVGCASLAKREKVIAAMKGDALIITRPENICWLLNIRAADVAFTPLLLVRAILFKNGEVALFIDQKRIKDGNNPNLEQVCMYDPNVFLQRAAALKNVQIDPLSTHYDLYEKLDHPLCETDPIDLLKACKNDAEIRSAVKAHQVDGVAVTAFLFWLEETLANGEQMDEMKASNQLETFRRGNDHFIYPSFGSISSFASNGAIIHYQASAKTNKAFQGDSLYLIDSGGQYYGKDFFGTTDVTRTVAIGNPSRDMIRDFTLVLKGHIALATAKFAPGTTGAELDILARGFLKDAGKDYDHGTGHGVGSFLSVHEGPCNISKRSKQPLLPGMILSNEPGFYKEGEYGIRIENVMVVEECEGGLLGFKTLTLVPIDMRLVDMTMLDEKEKEWLEHYHHACDALSFGA